MKHSSAVKTALCMTRESDTRMNAYTPMQRAELERKARATMATAGKATLYRVYVAQVNQTYVDVRAVDVDDAHEKAYRKWRRDYAHATILSVETL